MARGSGQRPLLLDQGGERAVGQVGHHQVGDVAGLAKLVDRDDIGMIKGGGGVSLALESGQKELPGFRITSEMTVNDLDGHVAMGALLARQEDGAHAADTQRILQNAGTQTGPAQGIWIPAGTRHLALALDELNHTIKNLRAVSQLRLHAAFDVLDGINQRVDGLARQHRQSRRRKQERYRQAAAIWVIRAGE